MLESKTVTRPCFGGHRNPDLNSWDHAALMCEIEGREYCWLGNYFL